MKKGRGLKRKWQRMLDHFDELSANISESDDELFIAESAETFNRKIDQKHQIYLLKKLLATMEEQQKKNPSKVYLLWYMLDDFLESVILIFNEEREVEEFFHLRSDSSENKSDYFLLSRGENPTFDDQLLCQFKHHQPLCLNGHFAAEPAANQTKVVIFGKEPILSLAKKGLSN